MATLAERRPGVWEARAYVKSDAGGKQVRKTFYGSKRDVRRAVAEWETVVQGTAPSGVGVTIGRLLGLWAETKAVEWQPTTIRDQEHRVRSISADLGTLRAIDLDPLQVDAWVARMRKNGVGEGAIRGRVTSLRAALNWGISRRLVRSNAVAEAKPKVVNRRRVPGVRSEDVLAILDLAAADSARTVLILRLAAATGAREAELAALAWDDLDGNRLRIGRQRHSIGKEALVRDRTKTGNARTVVLDPTTIAAIEAWKAEVIALVGESGQWMLGWPGAAVPPSPRSLYDLFRRIATKAGVPVGREAGLVFHDLRHWAGSIALRDGHDPVTVAARLGHSPDTLLRIYAEEIADGQTEVANSVEARLRR